MSDGEDLRTRTEDQWFDRKSGRIQARDLAKTLVAFANAEGGTVAVGIEDDGTPAGFPAGKANEWRQAARTHTEPPVRHEVTETTARSPGSEPVAVLLITVSPGEVVHRLTNGDVYLRVGDSDRQLRPPEVAELEFDRGQASFESRAVAGSGLADIDGAMARRYMEAVGASTPMEDVLEARGLALRIDTGVALTYAGLLILGGNPQLALPEAYLRVVEYADPTRETGPRANVLSDRRFDGPLAVQVEAAAAYLRQKLPSVIRLGADSRFARTTGLPEPAWLEAVVNASVHRSYSLSGDHTRIELFPGRVEVTSPGRLPGLVRLDRIRTMRFARNPRIARAMADLGYGRELGEGVDRMFEEMERAGYPAPAYQELPGALRVTLRADPVAARAAAVLSADGRRVLEAMLRLRRASTSDLATEVGLARPTVLRHLVRIAEQGLVRRVGNSPKDPRSYWEWVPPADTSASQEL